ncbi:CpaE family protein [Agromyces sp. NPDC056965]|uniref:AAA family ATPase n=1 Tax=Agromyces sp. NPDC056965 TaxID=3345983 RepID=UPI00362F71CC
MIPFLLVSRSTEYETRLRGLLGARLHVVAGEFLTFGADAVLKQVTSLPRIALLGPVLNYEETRELVFGLQERYPGIGLIVVREQRSDLEDWVDALALQAVLSPASSDETTLELIDRLTTWLIGRGVAAASDFEPATEPVQPFAASEGVVELGDLEDRLAAEDAAALSEPVEAEPIEEWAFPPLEPGARSEAIAVVAPKGGQGKTTLSINLASGLAEIAPNSVVLIDADLQFGDITAVLALQPERTIVDAVLADADELVLKTTLTHHPDGFFVVASVPSPELADDVQPAALAALIERLRSLFQYVVIDTTPGLGEHTLATIEHSTDAVFVTNMGVASLRAMRTEFSVLTRIGLMPSNRHVVLNFSDRMSGLTTGDVEKIIGAPIDVEIPRSSAVLLAANRGIPLIHDDVRDPAAKAIRSLVLRIAPDAYPKRSKIQRRRRINEPV